MEEVSQEFLDFFCVRLDQIPIQGNIGDCLHWEFNSSKSPSLNESEFNYYEGTINFTYNGVTYLSRDGDDVRAYLSSKGFKDCKHGKRADTILAAWYSITSKMIYKYHVDDPVFRKYAAIAFPHQLSPTLDSKNIGRTDEEIHRTIERVREEEAIFSDDASKWLESEWGKYLQVERDRLLFDVAVNHMQSSLDRLGYGNVHLKTDDISIEARERIINYWLKSNGIDEQYSLSGPYKDLINGKNFDNNNPIIIDTEYEQNPLMRPKPIATSVDEVVNALDSLINSKNNTNKM